MTKRLLMGNEAIALGAIRAGVKLASGYPGTPSSEILETITKTGGVYTEWSVNEKAALEVAAGAAIAGARVAVTMKQVGLNVASDPLMSLNYVGVKGGMVVVAADDPGPISSQTEQDTRHFGQFAKLAVFDPSTPEEAYLMIGDAFDFSEKTGRPVIFRPTTRVCHSYATVDVLPPEESRDAEGFTKNGGKWVIFPRLAYLNHIEIEKNLISLTDMFSDYRGNILCGRGKKGVAAGGVSYCYAKEALNGVSSEYKLLKIGTVPLPRKLCEQFLEGLDEVLVVEELDPVIERGLNEISGGKGPVIKGKLTGDMPNAGENTPGGVAKAAADFLAETADSVVAPPSPPPLPVRPPVLCAGCPHRASFFAVKEAAKGRKAVFSGDIGCYTLGNAMPLDMVDTCLCMGAGITMAQGLNRVEPDAANFAFIGDSTFFHTGISGVINAVYNGANIIIAILDNFTTAMTGNQPHPGVGKTASGSPAAKISIKAVLNAVGVNDVQTVNAFDLDAAKDAALRAMSMKGVKVIIFEGPCVALSRGTRLSAVDSEKCSGCGACVNKLGCPALSMTVKNSKKAVIDSALCSGCGLCEKICPFEAIKGSER